MMKKSIIIKIVASNELRENGSFNFVLTKLQINSVWSIINENIK